MSGRSRALRAAISLILLTGLLVVAPLGTPTAQASVKLTVDPAKPIRGEVFTVTGTFGTDVGVRDISLQRKSGKTWKWMADGVTDADGAFAISGSTTASSLTVRVVAGAQPPGTPAVSSDPKTITTLKASVSLSAPTTAYLTQPMTLTVKLPAARPDAFIVLEEYSGGSWFDRYMASTDRTSVALQVVPQKVGSARYRAVARMWDGAPDIVSASRTVKVKAATSLPLRIDVPALHAGGVGAVYSAGLAAFGGTPGYRWSATGLPKGLSLAASGAVTGTPTRAGTYTVKATVKDSAGHKATAKLPLRINADASRTAIQVVGGEYHSCALTADGNVRCWGANNHYQLGTAADGGATPAIVPNLDGHTVALASTSNSICALSSAGTVKCWGSHYKGEPGNGNDREDQFAGLVSDLSDATSISAGTYHFCVTTGSGSVDCWGDNSGGQLGTETPDHRSVPTTVAGVTASAVAGGGDHTCALADGQLTCWGSNALGQLGVSLDAVLTDIFSPMSPTFARRAVAQVAAGAGFTCAVTTGGAAECWGTNDAYQRGNDSAHQMDAGIPSSGGETTPVKGLAKGVHAVSANRANACALTTGGAVYCWGSTASGDFLIPNYLPTRRLTSGVVGVGTGQHHTCVVTTRGGVKCWGDDSYGQVGVEPPEDNEVSKPVSVPAFG